MTTAVSFVMPVRNEAGYIEGAIGSIRRAAELVPDLELEILVVDGLSDDETRTIVNRLIETDNRIRLLDNPQRTVPHAMNLGIKAAKGEIIIRLDGHAEIEPEFIANALTELRAHPECACVGGPIDNVNQGQASQAISDAMASAFGVGNARFRTGGHDGYVDTLAFGAYRKSDLLAVGLYDETLVRNEDDDLSFRLIKAGRKIWFSNRIRSRYYVRSELGKLYRQYFQYGYWKVYVNRKHCTVTSLRQLAPPLLVAALALLAALAVPWPPARWLLALVAGAYTMSACVFASRTRPTSLRHLLLVIGAFATLHVAYGLGYWSGLLDFVVLRKTPAAKSSELSR